MNGYQNQFFHPYGFMQQPAVQPAPAQIVRVSGENGAKSYQMGANSSALLLDESGLIVWVCTTDGAGYKTVSAYDITPHKSVPAPDYGSLESRIQRLEEIVNGNTRNTHADRKKQSEDDAD